MRKKIEEIEEIGEREREEGFACIQILKMNDSDEEWAEGRGTMRFFLR